MLFLAAVYQKAFQMINYAQIIGIIKERTRVVLDTSGKRLKDGIQAGADIIKPNKEELEQAFDVEFYQ